VNRSTPRIFVAATRQNDGKTTLSMGLFAAFAKRLGRIGYIKPVGQRFIEVDGKRIDEDSVLMERTFRVAVPLEAMSPIAIEPDFTRRYIEHANNDFLVKRLRHSFDRIAWEKELVIAEGSGHAGVGSVFDLSNARVAHLLESKVALITRGGVGRAIDEIALNKALFDREGVELAGAIINKVLPEKMGMIRDVVRRGLTRLGIDLIGVIPAEPVLGDATLDQVRAEVKGEFLTGASAGRRRVENVIIGAMNSSHALRHFTRGTLVVTPGDREDLILAAISTSSLSGGAPEMAGLVLSGDLLPHDTVLELLRNSNLPAIASPLDSYNVANRIHSMTVKTLPGDHDKIVRIQSLIEEHVEIDRLLDRLIG
jgi:BioD-like phosphotransacetylase family protein